MAQDNLSALIPYPNYIIQTESKEDFSLTDDTFIYYNDSALAFAAGELKNILLEQTGMNVRLSNVDEKIMAPIALILDTSLRGEEAYTLDINSRHIRIKGRQAKGVYYAIMTLQQIMMGDVAKTSNKTIKPVRIEDAPILPYRALMLDPARHFLPVPSVKKYIRQMAAYKFNTLQLHLSDDQGWRLEIKSHPRLTEIGAFPQKRRLKSGAAQWILYAG